MGVFALFTRRPEVGPQRQIVFARFHKAVADQKAIDPLSPRISAERNIARCITRT